MKYTSLTISAILVIIILFYFIFTVKKGHSLISFCGGGIVINDTIIDVNETRILYNITK